MREETLQKADEIKIIIKQSEENTKTLSDRVIILEAELESTKETAMKLTESPNLEQ
jgi:hypothetical protein